MLASFQEYYIGENEGRELIGEYAMAISKLLTRLLSLISLGLGLDKDYFERRHGQSPRRRAQANFYPPCPAPEVALGLAPHTDLNTLTILQQSDHVSGLQVIKDGTWVTVDPIPGSFVVNVGDQLQVLSNGGYKSVHHMFFGPDEETRVAQSRSWLVKRQGQQGLSLDMIIPFMFHVIATTYFESVWYIPLLCMLLCLLLAIRFCIILLCQLSY